MAEGGGLLNRYRTKSSIGGSNPPLSATPLPKLWTALIPLINQILKRSATSGICALSLGLGTPVGEAHSLKVPDLA